MRYRQLKNNIIAEACIMAFDSSYKHKYSHVKSRKLKTARKHVIYESLRHDGNKFSDIKNIVDDYYYWIARYTHKRLYPNTPDNFYVQKR